MDDSALFMEWAMDTLEQEHPDPVVVVNGDAAFPSFQALREQRLVFEELITGANPASSGSSGETTESSGGYGANFSSPAAMEHDVWPPSPPTSARRAPRLSRNGGGTRLPVTSWNFCAASALPASDGTLDSAGPVVPEAVYGSSQPTRRAAARSPTGTGTGPVSSGPPYAQDHIMAERKRREKINQRFIELSTVIPGLKKMDKATILSDATRHVKELQEKIKALEAATGRASSSIETVVLVKKKPRHADAAALSDQNQNGSPSSASSSTGNNPLPEIEVRFSETGVMVRILCHDVKGVVVRVLSEVEEGLHLTVTHANVMPFTACTLIITITAKVDEGYTVTAEEIVGRLNYVLELHSSCTSSEEK